MNCSISVCACEASPLPWVKGIEILWPALLAPSSTPATPAKTIKSAIETVPLNWFWIPSSTLRTLFSSSGLFTFQLLWGSNLNRAPLAPPRLSESLYVDAEAQAVFTNSETVRPDAKIIFFKDEISESLNV